MTNQKTRPSLPLSLKKKRLRNILLRTISCFVLLSLALVSIILWGGSMFPFPTQSAKGLRIFCYALMLVLPFVVTGVPFKLIDRSFSGTICKVMVKDSITSKGIRQSSAITYVQSDLILTIEKDDGKTIEYTRLSFRTPFNHYSPESRPGNVEHHKNSFVVGDRVHKYYGFRYVYTAHSHPRNDKYCIVCGQKNENKEGYCWSCGAELID